MLYSIQMRKNCSYLWPLELLIQISHSLLRSRFLLRNQKYPILSSSRPAKNLFGTTAIHLQSIFQIKAKALLRPSLSCSLIVNYSCVTGTQFRTSERESTGLKEVIYMKGERTCLMRPGIGFSYLILRHYKRIATDC